METGTSNQTSVVFLRKMDALRTNEYYELYNESFKLVGKIVGFPATGPGIEHVEREMDGHCNSDSGQMSMEDCYFDPSLKSELCRLEINELIACNRQFADKPNNLPVFFKLTSSNNALITEEGEDEESTSLKECAYLLKGLSSLVAAFLFVSFGGWWWIPTIASACYSLNCFKET